jgi:xanthine dehydrogenase iron-sulfur cluster and FAD-binding subunit A
VAANVEFKPGTEIIHDINMAFGGMACKTVVAAKTKEKLIGK